MTRTPTFVAGLVVLLALTGCASSPEASGTTPARESTSTTPAPSSSPLSTVTSTPTPTPTPTRAPGTYMLGETSEEFDGGILTVQSVEIVKEIATTDGVPITAAPGEQLVLFRTHFVNKSTGTVDLSCAGVLDWYVQVFDTEERELAAVFDTYRIPGNQECNHGLLSGQEADWIFAYRGIEGSTPLALQITDSRTFNDWIAWSLTDEPLRLKEN